LLLREIISHVQSDQDTGLPSTSGSVLTKGGICRFSKRFEVSSFDCKDLSNYHALLEAPKEIPIFRTEIYHTHHRLILNKTDADAQLSTRAEVGRLEEKATPFSEPITSGGAKLSS
jgi:hypothetical protein